MSRRSYRGPIRPRVRDGCDRGWGTPGHSLAPWSRRGHFVVDARGRTVAFVHVEGVESPRRADANLAAVLAMPRVLAAAKAVLEWVDPVLDRELTVLLADLAEAVAAAEPGYRGHVAARAEPI